ncbi:hypothetical protein PBY51_013170 [Eleginops maclovinus]|uniref:Uncharacterized protein n=1 Tax=Eleginops maclovinus TaxID=56733 RepID=A0AAN8AXN9_ELEMC|nr:hypothetical protein PBY51_013170 [Eleginops maclovinus]
MRSTISAPTIPTERCAAQRTQANVTDDLMCMRKMDHGGLLPAGNEEDYSMITTVPAAVCLTGELQLYN